MALLLSNGAKIELADASQRTPLILAFEAKNLQVARRLFEEGANPDTLGPEGLSLLHLSCVKQARVWILLALDHKANIDLPSGGGLTPLDILVSLFACFIATKCLINSSWCPLC